MKYGIIKDEELVLVSNSSSKLIEGFNQLSKIDDTQFGIRIVMFRD